MQRHGRQRHALDLDLVDVVREYGLWFDTIVDVAEAQGLHFGGRDLVALSRCLFVAAADAVTAHAAKNEATIRAYEVEHLAFVAEESGAMSWAVIPLSR